MTSHAAGPARVPPRFRRPALGALLAAGIVLLPACVPEAPGPRPPSPDPPVSPAVRASVGDLREGLRDMAGSGSAAVAVVAGGRTVWREAFGPDSADGARRYPLHDVARLLAAAAVAAVDHGGATAGGSPPEPEAAEHSGPCGGAARGWSARAGGRADAPPWPAPVNAFLRHAGVREALGADCSAWALSATGLARVGAALADGRILPERDLDRLLGGEAVRVAVSVGPGGGAALLVDRSANLAVALLLERPGPVDPARLASEARRVGDALLARLPGAGGP